MIIIIKLLLFLFSKFIQGLERIAEELMGRKKWTNFQAILNSTDEHSDDIDQSIKELEEVPLADNATGEDQLFLKIKKNIKFFLHKKFSSYVKWSQRKRSKISTRKSTAGDRQVRGGCHGRGGSHRNYPNSTFQKQLYGGKAAIERQFTNRLGSRGEVQPLRGTRTGALKGLPRGGLCAQGLRSH